MKLFVYGTLKRGHCRAFVLDAQRFLREAVTQPRYRLHDVGPYPALVQASENGKAIEGELWEIEDALFTKLDAIEGVDVNLFARRAIAIESETEVSAYFYLRDVSSLPDLGPRWERLTPFAEL
ncbi:MAG: gamma-glutamylcyclotransferase family protein [Phycisphaeraceae bacterium]